MHLAACAVVVAIRPHISLFSDPAPSEEYDLIVVVDEQAGACPGFAPHPHDQVHLCKFVDRLDHHLTLHTGLGGNVVEAVPADVQFIAEALAEKQVDQHLPWNQPAEDVPVYIEVTSIGGKMPHGIAVGAPVPVDFHGSPHRLCKFLFLQAVDHPRHRPDGFDTALVRYGGLLHADRRAAVQRLPDTRQAAQVGVDGDFLCVHAESEDLIGEFEVGHGVAPFVSNVIQKSCQSVALIDFFCLLCYTFNKVTAR